ncbi:lysoplasmalogenase [Clostridium sp. YIM B02515]|uniref:Lysoplasmalogenase n=1 Tax=Clostridium rhizosphaerae TaxID=2803861 RepID=A0ABS1TDI5_9CLOT|nr:lysoplasmalogenase [Clostridium rhizosphaerae]MBL4937419.1 lysoplasmalogenase [Clostridium rhizosphaerae]
MTIKLALIVPFLILCILNVFYEKNGKRKGVVFTKPLLMPLLGVFYSLNTAHINYYILLALTFGFLGDVFLLKNNRNSLVLAGIVSFLIGHVFYIFIFALSSYMLKPIPIWFLLFLLPYIGIAYLMFKKLLSTMESMKFPAIIYMCVLCTMSFMSLSRIWAVSLLSFMLTFLGSLSFLISDSILAFDMFSARKGNNGAVIMATYTFAQLLIVIGLLV